ncbi:MAG: hemerythrin family protein [Treponema sp.]|nr:hemerythrin family protein [Treponema sp.]
MKDGISDEASAVWHNLLNHNVFIVWKPEYNLGIPVVDEQHRGVVSIINSLHYGIQSKHGINILKPVINMITEYTRIHFEVEENFLTICKFPDLKNHCELHNELIRALSDAGRKSVWEQDPGQFMGFLKKWWIEHICDKDRLFRDYLVKMK